MNNSENNQVQWKFPAGTYWQELCEDAKSWEQLVRIQNFFRKQTDFTDQEGKRPFKFIFRGQGPYGNLKTSIERAFEEFEIEGNGRSEREKQSIRSFQRKAPYHLKEVGVPTLDDTLGWLSLMQNHGAPTRLHDWTYSFYRAVYKAVQEWKKECPRAEIWVMDTNWFTDKTENRIRENINKEPQRTEKERKRRKKLLDALNHAKEEITDYTGRLANNRNKLVQYLMDLEEPLSLVYNVTPIGLNERIIYQQGTFVLPGDITNCFMQNLEPYGDECKNHLYRIVINLEQQERNNIIEELHDMNINEAVLFPGLDGFARSMRMQLAFPHKFGDVVKPPKKKSTTNR